MFDLAQELKITQLFPPKAAVTDNTAFVSNIIDVTGCVGVVLAINLGALTDVNMTGTVLVEEGDDPAMADNAAVDDRDLIGTEAGMAFQYDDDDKTLKIGYRGSKKYLRVTVTPANNDSGNIFLAGVAIRKPRQQPQTDQKLAKTA